MESREDIISKLAGRKNVKKIAVENFLISLHGLNKDEAIANLEYDAKLYKWNSDTVKAIRDGIKLLVR